jgi:hypothetical protein
VYQILSFQIDPTIQLSTEIPGKIEGRWPSREVLLEGLQLALKLVASLQALIGGTQICQGLHERFRHK